MITLQHSQILALQGVISYISKGWGGRVSDKHNNSQTLRILE